MGQIEKHIYDEEDDGIRLVDCIKRDSGLAISIACDEYENANRIKFILDVFIAWYFGKMYTNCVMQSSPRSLDDWKRVEHLPNEFRNTVYRLKDYDDIKD